MAVFVYGPNQQGKQGGAHSARDRGKCGSPYFLTDWTAKRQEPPHQGKRDTDDEQTLYLVVKAIGVHNVFPHTEANKDMS